MDPLSEEEGGDQAPKEANPPIPSMEEEGVDISKGMGSAKDIMEGSLAKVLYWATPCIGPKPKSMFIAPSVAVPVVLALGCVSSSMLRTAGSKGMRVPKLKSNWDEDEPGTSDGGAEIDLLELAMGEELGPKVVCTESVVLGVGVVLEDEGPVDLGILKSKVPDLRAMFSC